MQILTGTDIVEIKRIEALVSDENSPFASKCFTKDEQLYCRQKSNKACIESFAARFAAKEAVSKALGNGLCANGIGFTDIEVISENGVPSVKLHGKALELSNKLNIISMSISIAHEREYAVATCSMLSDETES